ncbi:MAG: PTS sugar transporter subunit IIA [Gammaproteobacteria bacterium]
MFDITSVLTPECTKAHVTIASKKKAIEHACELLAARHVGVDAEELFDSLLERERLGSTSVGEGVGLPHCRLDTCRASVAALIQLAEPIEFDSPDHGPVDLMFVLVVPVGADKEHLELLSHIAEALNDAGYRQALRAARSDAELFEAACAVPPPQDDMSRSA